MLHDPAVSDYQDHIRIAHGGQPVGDHDRSPSFGYSFHSGLDLGFRHGIHRGSGFIQDQDPGICQDGSGKRDQLFFAGGEQVAALAHIGVQPLFQMGDHFLRGYGGNGAAKLFLRTTSVVNTRSAYHKMFGYST